MAMAMAMAIRKKKKKKKKERKKERRRRRRRSDDHVSFHFSRFNKKKTRWKLNFFIFIGFLLFIFLHPQKKNGIFICYLICFLFPFFRYSPPALGSPAFIVLDPTAEVFSTLNSEKRKKRRQMSFGFFMSFFFYSFCIPFFFLFPFRIIRCMYTDRSYSTSPSPFIERV
jgi:hypothetical protein